MSAIIKHRRLFKCQCDNVLLYRVSLTCLALAFLYLEKIVLLSWPTSRLYPRSIFQAFIRLACCLILEINIDQQTLIMFRRSLQEHLKTQSIIYLSIYLSICKFLISAWNSMFVKSFTFRILLIKSPPPHCSLLIA